MTKARDTADINSGTNTAAGEDALGSNTTGAGNIALGKNALSTNTTASQNTALGRNAMLSNTTGAANTAVGHQALDSNTTGASNTSVGKDALQGNTTASNNTAVGYQSLYANTTGSQNTAFGRNAMLSNTTAGNTTGLGYGALRDNTTGAGNTGVGRLAAATNTTGNYNTALGNTALYVSTTGASNTALGYESLYSNTTASNNTAVGHQAGYANTTGVNNTAIGADAGKSITTAASNTMVGHGAGQNTNSDKNTFIGRTAGYNVTSGAKNTIIGRFNGNENGLDFRTESNNIVLSDGDGNPKFYSRSVGTTNTNGVWYASNMTAEIYWPQGGTSSGQNSASLANAEGQIGATGNADAIMYLNRNNADGDIVRFYSTGTQEGNISVSGTTVSYNGGHLSRWSQLSDGSKDASIVKGTVLTNLDQMAVWTNDAVAEGDTIKSASGIERTATADDVADAYTEDNEQLNCMAVSSVEGDANVAGVFVNWDVEDDMNIAMTGDMIIRIAQGTTVARGDLLMSAGDGTAKPQGDDIVRSKTIAKVTSTHVSNTYDDGSYCVPCVLMAC